MYEALMEFPERWGGVRKNPFRGGGMDIFWNYTISYRESTKMLDKFRIHPIIVNLIDF